MPVRNDTIAHYFEEIANLLELQQDNPFKIRAYRNAALTIRNHAIELSDMLAKGHSLTDLPGIGKDLSEKITEIIRTGRSSLLDNLHQQFPSTLEELLEIPSLGPKKVFQLYSELGILNMEDLYSAIQTGQVEKLRGFGLKTQSKILEQIENRQVKKKRFLFQVAQKQSADILAWMKKNQQLKRIEIAGSFRRCKEIVGDLDLLATIRGKTRPFIEHFIRYPSKKIVISKGNKRASIVTKSGLQLDLRITTETDFGAALYYFTGSKQHNISMRKLALRQGLKINEYGIFDQKSNYRIGGREEKDIFETLSMEWIPPELRENRGEIPAAQAHRLPKLVELHDLQGDLHCHTDYSDGHEPIENMIKAATSRQLSYLAITDHSKHLHIAHGLTEKKLLEQIDKIDQLNARNPDIHIFKGIEVDILENGSLDLSDNVLSQLDLVIGAIHDHFNLSEEKQTNRILTALEHPYFSILAHPFGRLLLSRPPYAINFPKILAIAKQRKCFIELNSQPMRLDVNDVNAHLAREYGVLIAINSDAHSSNDFNHHLYGIHQARRGWLEPCHILNCLPLEQVQEKLRATRLR